MAKKSRSSAKVAIKTSAEEQIIEPAMDLNTSTPGAGIIDFYYLFGGLGILMSIVMIIDLLLQYVFHIL